MARRTTRSVRVPITFGVVTVPLAAALLTAWTIFYARRIAESGSIATNVSLLVLGDLAFVVIMTVLVLFTIFLAREILEVRRQDSFIDSVTHELKSPLASLKLCLQTLERPDLPDDKRRTLRDMMQHDIDRLSAFIDDILHANRLAHGGDVSIELHRVNVRELADHCADMVRARHRLPREAISVDVAEDFILATDRAALELILRNLIDNAVKYSREAIDVKVRAATDAKGKRAVLEVQDHGIGIPKTELTRVFQRFYRIPADGDRKRKGTGLGLFVVNELVKNLGGAVRATSPGVDQGTTFRVELPIRTRA